MDPTEWQRWFAPFSAALFFAVGLVELRQPRVPLALPYIRRWTLNFALWCLGSFLVYFFIRTSSVALATSRVGTLGFLPLLLIFDACLWLSHFSMHHFGPLWIWHAVHHSDPDMDASTALRFHPLEGLWDQALLLVIVYLLRPSAEAVIGLQFFVIASNFFVHANVALPQRLDSTLAWILMTPGLHRSHHDIDIHSQKSNYGVTLTIWDRLFRTLHRRAKPDTLGIDGVDTRSTINPTYLLLSLPWREWRKL
jgi:sterol desaturase/sphingolipid hydroxylase (fatty acid hydroxylase superfamily)